MKLKRKESLLRSQQQFHRNNPWQLEAGGLFVPHLYSNRDADLFSWGDTTGFILNGRRILVSWDHPRNVYANQMNDIIYEQVGEPDFTRFRSGQETPWYKRVGRSRKKRIGYHCPPSNQNSRTYFDRLQKQQDAIFSEGIEFAVRPSWKRRFFYWATSVEIVAPIEVRNVEDLRQLSDLARRLLLGQTRLDVEFSDYVYDRSNWLAEMPHLELSI